MAFAEALDRHLAAIAARDAESYLATVHDDVSLVLPNGTLLGGRTAVAEFHRDWFSDPDWQMDVTVLHTATAGGTAVAVLDVDYRDVDAAGEPYAKQYLLGLVFTRDDAGTWLLLHDQNTFR
jgi:uncharacterized protein (TIGR02246 family)